MRRLIIFQHLEREGPGLFVDVAEKKGFEIHTFRLDLGDNLPEINKGDVLLILGGPMGIRDIGNPNYPWLINEVKLIKKALNQDIGIIGVCLGAQLLAYAAGGNIELLRDKISQQPFPEIGWHSIYSLGFEKVKKLTQIIGNFFLVLHWHGDRIKLPKHADLIASSSRCKEQLFRIGSLAYGLQFHVETFDGMVKMWIEEDKNFISSALGNDGQSILKKQQKLYEKKTLVPRLEFLDVLIDLVC
tara:strand:+ start:350 stop:1081 length:732 start_codon:yes stop_codon:yes gene_type:complete